MKRVVLDTNIVISSALGGALEVILDKWADNEFTVVVTSDIIAEYLEILNRPKFKLNKQRLTESRSTFINLLKSSPRPQPSKSSNLIHLITNFLKQQ